MLSAVSDVLVTIIAQRSGGAVAGLEDIQLYYRIANAFISYISYIGKTIWPSELAVIYPYLQINSRASQSGNMRTDISDCNGHYRLSCRRRKYLTVGWLWYAGTLIPVIGLVQVGLQAMANRYMYIPMVGLLIMAELGSKGLHRQQAHACRLLRRYWRRVVLFAMIILTRMQVRHWRDSITLFEYTLKVTEE